MSSSSVDEKLSSQDEKAVTSSFPSSDDLRYNDRAVVLEPVPTSDPADPLNWSWGWKHWTLAQVSFASLMSAFTAASIIPGFFDIAGEFNRSVNAVSYQVAVCVLGLAWGNILWTPLGNSYGRRPVYMTAMLMSLLGNIGGSQATTFSRLMAARFFQGFGAGAPNCTGASTIADLFFLHERGAKAGLWTYPTTIGPYLGPLIGGFLIQAKGWRWVLYLNSIINGTQLLLMIFTLPETLYIRRHLSEETNRGEALQQSLEAKAHPIHFNITRMPWKRIGRRLEFVDFLRPFQILKYPNVWAIVIPYTFGVAYSDIGIANLIPQTFGPIYHFDAAQQGLTFLGLLVGALVGEALSGRLSDSIVARKVRNNGGVFVPEMRLTMLPVALVLIPIGLFLWGALVSVPTHWIGPVVAGGVAQCGLQIMITISTTYLIDCYKPQAAITSTILFWSRQMYGFTLPFYNFVAVEKIGYLAWFGVLTGLTVVSFIPPLFLFKRGAKWRERWGKPTFSDEL